jgi:hypothetical protein
LRDPSINVSLIWALLPWASDFDLHTRMKPNSWSSHPSHDSTNI